MSMYITTKMVDAEPEEKEGEPGYKVTYPDGYVSWCPEDEFDRTSRPISDAEWDLYVSSFTQI